MLENNQIDLTKFENPIDVAVLVMGDNNVAYASNIVNVLRDENIAAVSYLDTDKKFKNQIEYADKSVRVLPLLSVMTKLQTKLLH